MNKLHIGHIVLLLIILYYLYYLYSLSCNCKENFSVGAPDVSGCSGRVADCGNPDIANRCPDTCSQARLSYRIMRRDPDDDLIVHGSDIESGTRIYHVDQDQNNNKEYFAFYIEEDGIERFYLDTHITRPAQGGLDGELMIIPEDELNENYELLSHKIMGRSRPPPHSDSVPGTKIYHVDHVRNDNKEYFAYYWQQEDAPIDAPKDFYLVQIDNSDGLEFIRSHITEYDLNTYYRLFLPPSPPPSPPLSQNILYITSLFSHACNLPFTHSDGRIIEGDTPNQLGGHTYYDMGRRNQPDLGDGHIPCCDIARSLFGYNVEMINELSDEGDEGLLKNNLTNYMLGCIEGGNISDIPGGSPDEAQEGLDMLLSECQGRQCLNGGILRYEGRGEGYNCDCECPQGWEGPACQRVSATTAQRTNQPRGRCGNSNYGDNCELNCGDGFNKLREWRRARCIRPGQPHPGNYSCSAEQQAEYNSFLQNCG